MLRIKVIIALIAVSSFFLALFYNQFEKQIFADKIEQVELQTSNQVRTMVSAYESDAKFLLKWANNLSEEGTQKINWSAMTPYFAVAHLNSAYQVIEWSFRDPSPISGLSKETLTQLVSGFQVNPEKTQMSFHFFQDQDKKRVLLTLIPIKSKLWVFASLGENLQLLMDGQKTQSSSLALVNKDLVSLAHVKSEYVGQKIFLNPVIKEIQDTNKSVSSGTFKITSGDEYYAVMEKVPNMELYLYSQSSLSELHKTRQQFKNQFIFFSVGFLFLLVGVGLLLVPMETNIIERRKPRNDAPESARPKSAIASSTNLPVQVQGPMPAASSPDSANHRDKVQSYMKIASAVGHEIRAPLMKIINLIQSQIPSENQNHTMEKIKSEVRAATDMVEKLLTFAGEKKQEKINTKIDTALLRAIKNLEPIFSQKMIKITKDIKSTVSLDIDVLQMTSVFENLLKNSVQALERRSNKEIKISTSTDGIQVFVEISDNGDGIPKEIMNKVFDPFFTTMNLQSHIGLGLPVALGIVKQHNGDILITSERGKGTTVKVSMRVSEEIALDSKTEQKPKINVSEPVTLNQDQVILESNEQKKETPALVSIIESEPNVFPSVGNSNLAIPKVDAEIVLGGDEEVTSSQLAPQDSSNPSGDNVDDNMFHSLNLTSSPVKIKPVDLNVNVDELFDDAGNDSGSITNKNENTNSAVTLKPTESETKQEKDRSYIDTPELVSPLISSKPSDSFQVTIRKPRRTN